LGAVNPDVHLNQRWQFVRRRRYGGKLAQFIENLVKWSCIMLRYSQQVTHWWDRKRLDPCGMLAFQFDEHDLMRVVALGKRQRKGRAAVAHMWTIGDALCPMQMTKCDVGGILWKDVCR
jgi:hypothetical protein